MNTRNGNSSTADRTLSDIELDAASGGAERREVTLAEYERILGQMIQANKDSKKGGGHGASGSW